jgi:hypothetical protein
MARIGLASMSVDALLKLGGDIEKALSGRADELRNQLSRLVGSFSQSEWVFLWNLASVVVPFFNVPIRQFG